MSAELLFIGTELLLGQILNTNAQYLSRRLAEIGIDLYRETVVGDNLARVEACVQEALGRAQILITSGGLGPTQDDLTKQAIAAVLGLEMDLDAAALSWIERFFAERGRRMTDNNRQQALIPRGAVALPNLRGTAPGVWLEHSGNLIVMLPGPPHELEAMFAAEVLPRLLRRQPDRQAIVSRVLHICGIGESEVETRLLDLIDAQGETTIAPLASLGEVKIRLTTKAPSAAVASARISPLEAEIRRRLGSNVFGVDGDTLPAAVVRLLAQTGTTVSLAESCTGGLLSDWLTDIPGVSGQLSAALVTYSNQSKIDLLGVPAALIEHHGAVSAEVCAAMALGARRAGRAAVGVAITGIAGPGGGSAQKPVGLVYIGLAPDDDPASVVVSRQQFLGDREMVKIRAARQALVMLREYLCTLAVEAPR